MKNIIKSLVFILFVGIGWAAQAREYVIGQVAELSGLGSANENTAGAKLWFDHI